MIPPIGTRFKLDHGNGFYAVVEYIGPNPEAEFPTADAHLIRRVESSDGKWIGHVSAIDVLWFENHTRCPQNGIVGNQPRRVR